MSKASTSQTVARRETLADNVPAPSRAPPGPHRALKAQLDHLLAAARPRLLRLAHARGVSRDDVDDVVQETLLTAWRRLEYLRSPDRFDAWLDGICYHLCQHHARRIGALAARQVSLADPAVAEASGESAAAELTDPQAFDPAEDLHHQDLQTLLDKALGYLAASNREALELCYLAELPQREAAARLGLTVSALESRLHRARRELRRLLSGELRTHAESFGLALDEDPAGWRETREWCNFCGRRQLQGTFEPLPGGQVSLRLRCPECSRRFGNDLYSSGGMVALAGLRSFRPAFKRLIQLLERHYMQDYAPALLNGWQPCPGCRRPVAARLAAPGGDIDAFPDQFRLVLTCPRCGLIVTPAAFALYRAPQAALPSVFQFIRAHPRWVMEPDSLTEYAGQPAIRFRLADVSSAAQLTMLADAHSLRVCTMLQE